jgi:hypothetical protein
MWLCKDVANILKDYADPLTYGRLLCTSKLFHPESKQRLFDKLSQRRDELIDSNPNPSKPLSTFFRFCQDTKHNVKRHFGMSGADISRELGRQWRELPTQQKVKYKEEYNLDAIAYKRAKTSKLENPEKFAQSITNWKNENKCVEYAMMTVSLSVNYYQSRIIHTKLPLDGRFWA